MALEDLTGPSKYLSALVATNPTPDDFRDEGDDHIRGIKNVLLNTFGPIAGPFGGTGYVLFQQTLIGMMNYFLLVPNGWLELKAQTLALPTMYPDLWAWVQANPSALLVPEASYNAGSSGFFCYPSDNPANGLKFPDFRGVFLRGFDDGRGLDSGRGLGVYQDWAVPDHSHSLTDPTHSHWLTSDHAKPATSGGTVDMGSPGSGGTNTQVYNASDHDVPTTTGITLGGMTGPAAGNVLAAGAGQETRPKNQALRFCIFAGRAS